MGEPETTPSNDAWKSLALAHGTEVTAFFRSNAHPDGDRYVKTQNRSESFPIAGLSAGWLTALVLSDYAPSGFAETDRKTHVHVRFSGVFRDPRHGNSEGLEAYVHPSMVKRFEGDAPVPLLSLFCVRWWDYWTNTEHSDHDITSDGLIVDLFDGPCGMNEVLPGEYEVHTAWVKKSDDLKEIAGHSGETVRALLKAPNIAAWPFLRALRRQDADAEPGGVCEFQFFALCQRLERAGIPCGWPYISHLHRQICGKMWVPQMCLDTDFKVPATSRVHYAEFAEAGEEACERAIEALLELRKSIGLNQPSTPHQLKGVAKLGFNSATDEVLPFCGAKSLANALHRLYSQPTSNQIVCIVQEMVPDVVCQQSILCFHDAVNSSFVYERVWLRMAPPGKYSDVHDFARTSDIVVEDDVALRDFFSGSAASKRKAEKDADFLVDQWLLWFSTECPEPPQMTRLDFLVSCPSGQEPSVWTCDISECGSSLCGVGIDIRNASVLNSTMRNDESGRFPRPLPPVTRSRAPKC